MMLVNVLRVFPIFEIAFLPSVRSSSTCSSAGVKRVMDAPSFATDLYFSWSSSDVAMF